MRKYINRISNIIGILILCAVFYKAGEYSDRTPPLKDVPKYFKNFSKYREFLKLKGENEIVPSLSSVENIPRYLNERTEFENLGGKISSTDALLHNYDEAAGITGGCYFHQDLIVASYIYKDNPIRHIDIASRFDGFISHVASFRKIEVMDIRNATTALEKENIYFTKIDLMDENNIPENITDSISSLHALEHFGLGRYGDPIDPKGHIKGFNNMLRMLKPGGVIYVSFPISTSNQVNFNSERRFNPLDVLNWVEDKYSLELVKFDYVDIKGNLHQDINLYKDDNLKEESVINCGIYTFRKLR